MESQSVYPILCFSKPEATNELIVQPRARGYGSAHPSLQTRQLLPVSTVRYKRRFPGQSIQVPITISHECCSRKEANGLTPHLHIFKKRKRIKEPLGSSQLLSIVTRRVMIRTASFSSISYEPTHWLGGYSALPD